MENPDMAKIERALRLAAEGHPGMPNSAQRLAWILYGAAGWRLRAIVREESWGIPPTVNFIVRSAAESAPVSFGR